MNFLQQVKNSIGYNLFIANGKKPWTPGYGAYRRRQILNALASDFNPLDLKPGYGFRLDERVVEYPWFFSRLSPNSGKLLDAGSVLNYDFIISHKSLINKKLFISTLAPEKSCFWRQGISYVYEDLREISYRDNYFDWVASISTVEHIGLDNTFLYTTEQSKNEENLDMYLLAINNFNRVLKKGGTLYLTVPFGKHKNYRWFQIFDSEMLDKLINTFAPSAINEFHFKYEASGWRTSSREESKDATYFDIHEQKAYDSDYAAASRAIVCLEMVK